MLSTTLALVIEPDHPCLAGHFPGAPIVPAALLLAAFSQRLQPVIQAAGVSVGEWPLIGEWRQLRLQAPALPGRPLELQLQPVGTNSWQLHCLQRDTKELICKARFSSSRTQADAETEAQALLQTASRSEDRHAASYEGLPHAGTMGLLQDFYHDSESHFLRSEVTLPADPDRHPLSWQGQLHSVVALEYAAQLLACFGVAASAKPENTLPAQTRVVQIKRLQVWQPLLTAGQPLTVGVELLAQQPDAISARFVASQQDRLICSGQLLVMR